jgi:hypothetical protein
LLKSDIVQIIHLIKLLEGENMVDDLGFGKVEGKSIPVDCKMHAISAGFAASTSSALCDRTDCQSYGKWWCPFTGW